MKILKLFSLALLLGVGVVACNDAPENDAETIEVEERDNNMNAEAQEPEVREVEEAEDDDALGIDVSVDEKGNVDGKASGKVTIGDDDDK